MSYVVLCIEMFGRDMGRPSLVIENVAKKISEARFEEFLNYITCNPNIFLDWKNRYKNILSPENVLKH